MIYAIYFSNAGVPAEGLSPVIDVYIKTSDGTSAGAAPAVGELSGGFYTFTATPSEAILCRVNGGGGIVADSDRYKVLQITLEDDNLDAAISTRALEDGGNLAAIKAKTDTLPPKLFVKNLG